MIFKLPFHEASEVRDLNISEQDRKVSLTYKDRPFEFYMQNEKVNRMVFDETNWSFKQVRVFQTTCTQDFSIGPR